MQHYAYTTYGIAIGFDEAAALTPPVEDFPIRNTGIDGLYRHGDTLVIVEAKGSSAGLKGTLGKTKYGEQLSQQWIYRKAEELKNLGSSGRSVKPNEVLDFASNKAEYAR